MAATVDFLPVFLLALEFTLSPFDDSDESAAGFMLLLENDLGLGSSLLYFP